MVTDVVEDTSAEDDDNVEVVEQTEEDVDEDDSTDDDEAEDSAVGGYGDVGAARFRVRVERLPPSFELDPGWRFFPSGHNCAGIAGMRKWFK